MNIIWRSLGSVVIAVVFLFLVGYVHVRTEMLELGLVLSWDLLPLRTTTPQVAVLELTLLFLVFGAVALLYLMHRRGLSGRTGIPALIGALTLIVISGWHMATVEHAVQMPADMNESGNELGWVTGFETGALSSTTHGMAALLLVIALLKFNRVRSSQESQSTEIVNTY